jgi:S-layer protein (TIGR01567 family)
MKRFLAVTLAALMLLTVVASAATTQDAVEIRGPVYNGSNIESILGDNGTLTIGATQFAAFYYDIDDNVTTETLSIKDVPGTKDNVIGEGGLVYQTKIQQVAYEYENAAAGWDNYSLMGFFADKYIPLKPTKADKLAKLVLDSDDKYTIRTGETLDLGQGYTLEAKQVDVDGEKVWLQFNKDGEFVDDEIIEVGTGDSTWNVELDDIQDEDDVVVLKVHVNQVFQGAVDSIAQIEGLWLIDYANAMTIESDDEFGELNDVSINGDTLTISNEDTFTLTRDSEEEIAQGMFFKTADTSSNVLRFYLMKQITEPGTYQIRGQVASGDASWDATSFAGFYYDINDNVQTESLSVTGLKGGNVIPDGGLVYQTSVKNVDYEYDNAAAGWDQYPVIGFFAEEYIPLKANSADKLAKLILDSDDKYTIRTGETLDLGQGYTLEAKQVDVDGEKVWLQFNKDGEFVDDEIISVGTDTNTTGGTWNVELDDIQDEDDVVVLKVHVNQVFQGAVDSIAQIEGLWLIDYANAMTIESDDEFGELNDVSINGNSLRISNEDTFTLTRDSDEAIGQGMSFKIADTPASELRYYPFVEKTLGNETTPTNNTSTSVGNITTPVEGNNTIGDNDTTPVDNMSTPGETPVEETPTEENKTDDKKPTPGFGFVFGLVGLLAVVYLVRRNN